MASGVATLNWTSEDAKPVAIVRVGAGEKARLGPLLHPTANTLEWWIPPTPKSLRSWLTTYARML